ncbi:MAG TPA: isochorismatase family cysteine hydrolase [Candidatus Eisenbacteria bacterium]|nr:isochorismatase family cysteine hydrolase [Candidatus Eisenbacteria bacterium]
MQIEVNYPEPVPVKLDPAKTMLLIVDMENEDAHPSGKRYMGEAVEEIIPKLVALRQRVRAAGGTVVHTQSVRKPDALEFTLFKNVVRKVEGTWGAEFIDQLKPAADESVVVKYTHDCFYRTEMEVLLERLRFRPGEGRIIVTGIAARGCVQCAVMGFSIRDFYVYVPIDTTTQRDQKEKLQAFSQFMSFGYRYNVTVTRSDLIEFQV